MSKTPLLFISSLFIFASGMISSLRSPISKLSVIFLFVETRNSIYLTSLKSWYDEYRYFITPAQESSLVISFPKTASLLVAGLNTILSVDTLSSLSSPGVSR